MDPSLPSVIIEGGEELWYFGRSIENVQEILQEYVDRLGARIKKRAGFDVDYDYNLSSTKENVLVYGRLYAGFVDEDTSERFLLASSELHLTPKFSIPVLKLRLPSDITVGICRGAVVAIKGVLQFDTLQADEIFTDTRSEMPSELHGTSGEKLSVCFGPYFESSLNEVDSFVERLLNLENTQHVFVGPFVQSNCPLLTSVDCEYTAIELTQKVIETLTSRFENSIVIATMEDAIAFPVFPTPPIDIKGPQFTVSSDPSVLHYSGVDICISGINAPGKILPQFIGPRADRPRILAKLLAYQATVCPVTIPVFQQYLIDKVACNSPPHVIITSTSMREVSETVDETTVVCVKPIIRGGSVLVIELSNGILSTVLESLR